MLGQVRAAHEIHHDEIRAAGRAAQAVYADNVRVMQPGRDSRFGDETLDEVGLVEERFTEELYRD